MKNIKTFLFAIFILPQLLSGQNYQELQKLQEEYKKVLERQSLQKPEDVSDAEKAILNTAIPEKLVYPRKDIESLLISTEKLLEKLKFYEDSINRMPYIGYDFFTKRDSIPFWQNIPISKNYILGPGDEIIISLWGESSSYTSEIINRDGQIFIDKVGILNIGGKSVIDAKNHIISKYSRIYSTLIGQNPKSFVDLTLGELKSVNIHFVGFVNIPGVHMVHPFSNVVTGLIQAGGVDIKGTLRNIKIIRNGETVDTIDLYNYLIKGKSFKDIRLLDQDIVYVPSRSTTVPITGRVLKPGYYEALENENLKNLIEFTGGKDAKSSKYIFVYKKSNSSNDGFIITDENIDNFKISNGDSLHFPIEPEFRSYVNIQGQVKNPGEYPYNSKMNLTDLLEATLSFNDSDFIKRMDLSKIKIFRKNPLNETPIKIITDFNENIKLNNGDLITVPSSKLLNPIESITITGEIETPGSYPVNNLTTLNDIINLSGGLSENALVDGIEIFRDSLQIAWDSKTFILNDGDSLNVLKKSGLVLVGGEVNKPGYINYKKNNSVRDYIKKAGGLTSFANKNNIYVVYPNGNSIPVSGWFSPKVKEGSKIHVNQRTISGSNEISGWQTFAMISGQAGSLATTLLSLSILLNQN